jgi:hypothetical protein
MEIIFLNQDFFQVFFCGCVL